MFLMFLSIIGLLVEIGLVIYMYCVGRPQAEQHAALYILGATLLLTMLQLFLIRYMHKKGDIPINDFTDVFKVLCPTILLTLGFPVRLLILNIFQVKSCCDCTSDEVELSPIRNTPSQSAGIPAREIARPPSQ